VSLGSGATFVARLSTDEATARQLSGLLGETFDLAETAVTSFEESDGRWVVEILFARRQDEATVRDLVGAVAGCQAAALTFATLEAKDWLAESIAGLKPVAAGRFVVHGRHDRARIAANRIGIEIEAAQAFGTGHHGTTRACLLALDRYAKSRRAVGILDVGTGSGVLAIAAARALRSRVLASDIDRLAVMAARDNAAHNRVGALVTVVHAGGVRARRLRERAPFDLVLANILLAPLKTFAAPLSALVGAGGQIVLSGLLPTHANAALAAYRMQGLALERRITLDGWVTLVMRKSRIAAMASSK
jgi:ribosomal protein L11 methyltransferase